MPNDSELLQAVADWVITWLHPSLGFEHTTCLFCSVPMEQ